MGTSSQTMFSCYSFGSAIITHLFAKLSKNQVILDVSSKKVVLASLATKNELFILSNDVLFVQVVSRTFK